MEPAGTTAKCPVTREVALALQRAHELGIPTSRQVLQFLMDRVDLNTYGSHPHAEAFSDAYAVIARLARWDLDHSR